MPASKALPRVVALALCCAAVAPAASAQTTIDFQDVPTGECAYLGTSTVSRGFRLAGIGDGIFACNAGVLQHNTTTAIINANARSVVTMSRVGGGSFTLNSFFAGGRTAELTPDDAVSMYTAATGIDIVGTLFGGGTVSAAIFLDALAPYAWSQYFLPGSFTGLQSVRFSAVGDGSTPEFLIDDIVVDAVTVTPEPGSFVLLATGLIGVLTLVRRRSPVDRQRDRER